MPDKHFNVKKVFKIILFIFLIFLLLPLLFGSRGRAAEVEPVPVPTYVPEVVASPDQADVSSFLEDTPDRFLFSFGSFDFLGSEGSWRDFITLSHGCKMEFSFISAFITDYEYYVGQVNAGNLSPAEFSLMVQIYEMCWLHILLQAGFSIATFALTYHLTKQVFRRRKM